MKLDKNKDNAKNKVLYTKKKWHRGVVVVHLPCKREVPGSISGRGSYLRLVSLH